MPVVLVLSLPFLVILARRPVLRRLAVRNARRRPREAALVLLGSLLGTAIITGSFIVGDTLEASIRRSAFTQLGPVDEVVQTGAGDSSAKAEAALSGLAAGAGIDGILPMVRVDAAVATAATPPRAEPQAQVLEVDFERALEFGGDAQATGIAGPTPAGNNAAIGRDLARTLDVDKGDKIEMFAYGDKRSFTVDRVLPRLGVAGFHLGLGSESPNVFVAPGTLAALAAGAPAGVAPPTSVVLVSNAGGVIAGAEGTAAVTGRIEKALAGIPAAVRPAKKDLLRNADEAGKNFTQLFGSIGFFSVLAGILLLVNIFVMLAEERKTELGMLRAVGLRRAGAVGAFSLEGWLYALVSSAIGTIAGLGVGRVVVEVAAGIFAGDGISLELRYSASMASVQTGFVIGFVISLATIVLTSIRVARLNVIRAIRDLPEPAVPRQRVVTLVLGSFAVLAGTVLAVSGLSGNEPHAALAGPALAGLGLVPLLRRLVPRRPLVTTVSATVLAWGVLCFDLAAGAFRNPEITVFVVDGVVLVAAAVALLTQNQDLIGRGLRSVGRRASRNGGRGAKGEENLSLRLGLAYPLARRFRTGMILTMYALVVFTLASITLFSDVFAGQVDDFTADVAGGADLRMISNPANPVPPEEVRALPGVRDLAALATIEGEFDVLGPSAPSGAADEGFEPWPLAGFDEDYVALGPPALDEYPSRFKTDEEAYRAVLADPTLIIVDEFFLQNGGGPPESALELGTEMVLRDPRSGRTQRLKVGALAESGFDEPFALVSLESLRAVAGDQAVPNQLRVATDPGVDPQELADSLNGRFLANGADAVSFAKAVGDGLQMQNQFFRLMQGYLALGLVVGIAGLGVVMVRAVRERRRQIGVLRALGFGTSAVRQAFLIESGFVALEGILVGVILAVLSTWRLLTSGSFGEGLEFTIPWGQLTLLVVLTFGASLLATLAPAHQASRIRPAVALRLSD
ncbi:MAG TPA: FtsX-like permease family protein [Acidimicrobiales bacterium]|nr:FtsX-like permease family protein [Acidimicrobiales bacterium]